MIWHICLYLTVALFIVAFIVYRFLTGKKYKNVNINIMHAAMVFCFAGTIIMCTPAFLEEYKAENVNIISAAVMSFAKAVKVFGGDAIFDDIMNHIAVIPENISEIYLAVSLFIQFLAPICTLSVVLSLLKNVSAYWSFIIRYNKNIFVFSDLNEKSYTLAKSIRQEDKNSVIVFTDIFEEDGNISELVKKVKKMRSICFMKDLLTVDFRRHSPKKKVVFLLMSENESLNTEQGLKLIEKYRDRKSTDIYVMSRQTECEILLSAAEKGELKVRRFNESSALINRIFYDNKMDIFGSATDDGTDEKLISALVVGMGSTGKETVKTLSWFCQMDGYKVRINAFDADDLCEERFTAEAPELMSEKYNGTFLPGEVRYEINIHSGIYADTNTFFEKVKEIENITYVMVSLGDDELNIKTAVSLRMIFERMGIHPFIHAVVYSSQRIRALKDLKNYSGQEYDINFIGDLDSFFSKDIIFGTELEKEALERHLKWGKEDDFWNYEYNYRSSVAAAIHIKARIACGITGAEKAENELTEEERTSLECLEHRRWNAYMRSEGYVYSGSTDKSSRNNLGKMHHNLVPYEVLSDSDKRKDSKVGTLK